MWTLRQVYAKNLCAFKQLDYTLLQKHTTLIFGNNMDNDSQGSNGSGKSAMLEAIAIADRATQVLTRDGFWLKMSINGKGNLQRRKFPK